MRILGTLDLAEYTFLDLQKHCNVHVCTFLARLPTSQTQSPIFTVHCHVHSFYLSLEALFLRPLCRSHGGNMMASASGKRIKAELCGWARNLSQWCSAVWSGGVSGAAVQNVRPWCADLSTSHATLPSPCPNDFQTPFLSGRCRGGNSKFWKISRPRALFICCISQCWWAVKQGKGGSL